MINNTEAKKIYEVSSGVTEYPIGFVFYFNPDQTPQLSVAIGSDILRLNYNCKLSEDNGSLILIPTEEEAAKLISPDDFSWMNKWVGAHLVIQRDISFVQESDYQLGRVSPEQIEKDFDLSVMRDQILAGQIKEHTDDVQGEIDALNNRIDFVQEEHVLDMAAIDEAMATKATKTELANAKTVLGEGIQGNADAILKTREDYQAADQNIRADMNSKDSELETILNDHTRRLDTLRTDHDDLGDDVSEIQAKIPQGASGSNPLITQQQLAVATYTKAEVDAKVSSVYKFKGSVASYGYLPSGAVIGDVYNVRDTGANYAWDGSSWDKLSETIDLSAYAKTEYVDAREQDIRADLGENISEVQTIVEGQAAVIAGKQDKLTAGAGITIDGNTISSTGGEVSGDYLPLSGGSLDDGARINWGSGNASIVGVSESSGRGILNINVGDYTFTFLPTSFYIGGQLDLTIDKQLGAQLYPWSTTYTKKLNAGRGSNGSYARDLILPTEGGTLARLEDLEELGGGDYLPLSGGTMTGAIEFEWSGQALATNNTIIKTKYNRLDTGTVVEKDILTLAPDGSATFGGILYAHHLRPKGTDGAENLGTTRYCFGTTYTKKINAGYENGANSEDLIVPTEGGTLARLEDITATVGDISTALTAILGE